MKRNDIILILTIIAIALAGLISLLFMQRSSGNVAIIHYQGSEVLHIDLTDGSYHIIAREHLYFFGDDYVTDSPYASACFVDETIYCVIGALGIVVIEYTDGSVKVIDETSPQNICQIQGTTNSPLKPLTCLPNHVLITIKDASDDTDDVIS